MPSFSCLHSANVPRSPQRRSQRYLRGAAWLLEGLPRCLLQHACCPCLLQPLLEGPTIDGFLFPALAISGAVDIPIIEQLGELAETQLIILCGCLSNCLDIRRYALGARGWRHLHDWWFWAWHTSLCGVWL